TGTVRNDVSSAIAKTNSVNRAQAVAEARRRGWL
ncbi:MAG: DNA-binding response regulator, partial [Cutibacterium avidum]|nr:DNA-binding response regulator [Cutibacterium avidum]